MKFTFGVVICALQFLNSHVAVADDGCSLTMMECGSVTNNAVTSRTPYREMDSANRLDRPESRLYCLVDLSGGTSAIEYPVKWEMKSPDGGWTDTHKTECLVLRRIEPGDFVMGEDKTSASPIVTLATPFYIGVFELTQRQWELVMGSRPSDFSDGYEKLPVENVSYEMIRGSESGMKWPVAKAVDDNSFFGKLRKKTGLVFDLPSEAQWEYACSAGGEHSREGWGCPEDGYMWFRDNSDEHTHEVGLKAPNAWGLFDMSGNVSEWCLDSYSPMVYVGEDPLGGYFGGARRAARGGSYRMESKYCTAGFRFFQNPTNLYDYIGFRVSLRLASNP